MSSKDQGKENFNNMLNLFMQTANKVSHEEAHKQMAHELKMLYSALRDEGFRDAQAMHIIDTILTQGMMQ